MFVMLSREVGSLIVSDTVILCPRCVELDGRTIKREDYPELFKWGGVRTNTWHLPDHRGSIPGASIWMIARPVTTEYCFKGCACCLREDAAPGFVPLR